MFIDRGTTEMRVSQDLLSQTRKTLAIRASISNTMAAAPMAEICSASLDGVGHDAAIGDNRHILATMRLMVFGAIRSMNGSSLVSPGKAIG